MSLGPDAVAWFRAELREATAEANRLRWVVAEVEAERDAALDDLDRTRTVCQHLEAALDDALGELADVRDRLAELRLRVVP